MFSADQIADIQGFNKVYQNLMKQMDSAILEAGYTLTEKDVLFEISKTERCTANILIQQLHIDRSYMSRMIAKFEKKKLIEKTHSKTDSRIRYIKLTESGHREINQLNDIKGYKKVFLLTITAQVIARHVYETHGFYKVCSEDNSEWGDGVIEERWELEIGE